MKKVYVSLLLGLISGLVTNYFLKLLEGVTYDASGFSGLLTPPFLIPGIVFGAISLCCFVFVTPRISVKHILYKSMLWVIICIIAFVASYLAAFYTVMLMSNSLKDPNMVMAGLLGGLVGSLILCFGLSFLFQKLDKKVWLIFMGALFGGVAFFIIQIFELNFIVESDFYPASSILHVIWQAGMLGAFCFSLTKRDSVLSTGE